MKKEKLQELLPLAIEKEMHFQLSSMSKLRKEYKLKEIIDINWVSGLPNFYLPQLIDNQLHTNICVRFRFFKTTGSLFETLYAITKNVEIKYNPTKQDFDIQFLEKIILAYKGINEKTGEIEIIELEG